MKKIAVFVLLFFVTVSASASEKKYLRISTDPVNIYRPVPAEAKIFLSTKDLFVVTKGGSGRVYHGWVPAGTEFVAVAAEPPQGVDDTAGEWYKAIFIRKCGNDVLNDIYFHTTPPAPAAQIQRVEAPATTPASQAHETVCLGLGTLSTGLGAAGLAYGLAAHQPVVAGIGIGLSLLGIWDPFDPKSDPRCKAAAGIIGGFGGYLSRPHLHHQESGGPVNPPPGEPGGPVNPPP